MTKLGGEYQDPAGPTPAVQRGRIVFLRKLEELAPEVLEKLATILPAFREALSDTMPQPVVKQPKGPLGAVTRRQPRPEWLDWKWESGDWDDVPPGEESLVRLKGELQTWGRDLYLDDPWILDVAVRTLLAWSHEVDYGRFRPPAFFDIEQAPDFTFTHRGWFPTWQDRAEYKHEIRKRFEDELRRYIEQQEKWAQDMEFEPAPEKRSGKATHRPDEDYLVHFEWLVLWQVGKKTQKEIAKEYGRHKRTIQIALKNAAEIIGLTRRSKR